MGKRILRTVLGLVAAVFTLAFIALTTLHGTVYDRNFFLNIPDSDYINTLTEQIGDILARDAQYYGVEQDAVRAMVNRADVADSVSLYYRDLYAAVTQPGAQMSYVEFPYTGYDTALREYFEEAYPGEEINAEAIREIAVEFAELTEDAIMLIRPDQINAVTKLTSGSVLQKAASLYILCGVIAAVAAVLAILLPGRKSSKASHISFGSAFVAIPAAAVFVLAMLFRRYDFKAHLVLSNGCLKLFANALIDRFLQVLSTVSGLIMIAAGLVLLISLMFRIYKRSKIYPGGKHHISRRMTRSTTKLVMPYVLFTAAAVLGAVFLYRVTIQTGYVQALAASPEQYAASSDSSAGQVELPIVIEADDTWELPESQIDLPVIPYRSQWATVNVDGWQRRDIPVYYADVDDADTLMVGAVTPGYSEFCGVGGRITMAAHVNLDFEEIETTEVGTHVHVATTYGAYEYIVDDVVIFEQEDTSYVWPNRDREELVMYTCWPLNNNLAPRVHRIALICHLEDDSDFLAALVEEHKGEEDEPLEDSDVIDTSVEDEHVPVPGN